MTPEERAQFFKQSEQFFKHRAPFCRPSEKKDNE